MTTKSDKLVSGKTVLITGGTGSFGRCMLNALLKTDAKSVKIMSRHEDLQVKMKREFDDNRVEYQIGDVRDYDRCLEIAKDVDIIFHAAALKHIDGIERYPMEAVKTNIMGTLNIKKAAIENCVPHVVGISTDKAVKPINTYGMTKAIDERILLNHEFETDTKFSVVRYGNVLGSRGSVIPFWHGLAKEGKTLPITDDRMTRFWISLNEAIELVFFAIDNPCKLVVRKCKSFALKDLAKIYSEKYKVPIKVVGMRPGEKIHEALLSDYEMRKAKSVGDFYIVDVHGDVLKTDAEDYTSENSERIKHDEMIKILTKESFL